MSETPRWASLGGKYQNIMSLHSVAFVLTMFVLVISSHLSMFQVAKAGNSCRWNHPADPQVLGCIPIFGDDCKWKNPSIFVNPGLICSINPQQYLRLAISAFFGADLLRSTEIRMLVLVKFQESLCTSLFTPVLLPVLPPIWRMPLKSKPGDHKSPIHVFLFVLCLSLEYSRHLLFPPKRSAKDGQGTASHLRTGWLTFARRWRGDA